MPLVISPHAVKRIRERMPGGRAKKWTPIQVASFVSNALQHGGRLALASKSARVIKAINHETVDSRYYKWRGLVVVVAGNEVVTAYVHVEGDGKWEKLPKGSP